MGPSDTLSKEGPFKGATMDARGGPPIPVFFETADLLLDDFMVMVVVTVVVDDVVMMDGCVVVVMIVVLVMVVLVVVVVDAVMMDGCVVVVMFCFDGRSGDGRCSDVGMVLLVWQ
jgi:hypothetical protein